MKGGGTDAFKWGGEMGSFCETLYGWGVSNQIGYSCMFTFVSTTAFVRYIGITRKSSANNKEGATVSNEAFVSFLWRNCGDDIPCYPGDLLFSPPCLPSLCLSLSPFYLY